MKIKKGSSPLLNFINFLLNFSHQILEIISRRRRDFHFVEYSKKGESIKRIKMSLNLAFLIATDQGILINLRNWFSAELAARNEEVGDDLFIFYHCTSAMVDFDLQRIVIFFFLRLQICSMWLHIWSIGECMPSHFIWFLFGESGEFIVARRLRSHPATSFSFLNFGFGPLTD